MARTSHRIYGGAHAVAVIFKIASILVIIGGIIAVVGFSRNQTYVGDKGAIYASIIGGTVFTAAAIAFFAYVLDLLIGIERNTFSTPSASSSLVPQPRPIAAEPTHPAPPPQGPAFPQPGWYADPQRVARVRYWDGRIWTQQTQQ
jgi:Protein of unknown function (DUF2510)